MLPTIIALAAETPSTTGKLASIITSDMINGVFDEILSMLPILLPVAIGFIGIRKAIGYVMGTIKRS